MRAGGQVGEASWYGQALAGRKTASGERFDPQGFTAAHRTLKLGTWVEVRRVDTGATVRVRINDRGPHVAGRIIDLSRRAAEELDMVRRGVVRVEVRVVSGP
ncbi:MAG: septal ring lytic transglycosylase RlpA family protein [Labilithrix sp.]|nr:septal ring lytic transglycosylase RlpA family protein [Labilithrix sp.]MCW5814558.1 septal ring lytic transglycosylase RlpA family protein [Labilithrix sp.]